MLNCLELVKLFNPVSEFNAVLFMIVRDPPIVSIVAKGDKSRIEVEELLLLMVKSPFIIENPNSPN